jgi:hypothetical protein
MQDYSDPTVPDCVLYFDGSVERLRREHAIKEQLKDMSFEEVCVGISAEPWLLRGPAWKQQSD